MYKGASSSAQAAGKAEEEIIRPAIQHAVYDAKGPREYIDLL